MPGGMIKVVYNDEIRRIDVTGLNFVAVKCLIRERFALKDDNFRIQYKDDENDLLTVSSDIELEDFFESCGVDLTPKLLISSPSCTATGVSTADVILPKESGSQNSVRDQQTLEAETLRFKTSDDAEFGGCKTECQVEMVDTDGDIIRFVIADAYGRVDEYVNGKLEIQGLKHIEIDEQLGFVRDVKGSFFIKEAERDEKLTAILAMMKLAGVPVMFASPMQLPYRLPMLCTAVLAHILHGEDVFHIHEQPVPAIFTCAGCRSARGVRGCSAPHGGAGQMSPTDDKECRAEVFLHQPGFPYEEELVTVLGMGFEDLDEVKRLLVAHGGDVNAVVAAL